MKLGERDKVQKNSTPIFDEKTMYPNFLTGVLDGWSTQLKSGDTARWGETGCVVVHGQLIQ